MPEGREEIASYKICSNFYWTKSSTSTKQWQVKALWADACGKESGTKKHRSGYVDIIGPTCSWKRGCQGSQAPLFPRVLRRTRKRPSPPSVNTLRLDDISHASRSIILHFHTLVLQVCNRLFNILVIHNIGAVFSSGTIFDAHLCAMVSQENLGGHHNEGS